MDLGLLDTNVILDDYYEKRDRHQPVLQFVKKFRYGELGHTNSVFKECVNVLTGALTEFSMVINNEIMAKSRGGADWDKLRLEKKEDIVKNARENVEKTPEKYKGSAPFLLSLFDLYSNSIAALSEQEIRELSLNSIDALVGAFANYLKARFAPINNYSSEEDSSKDTAKKIQSVLDNVFQKPYDTWDMKITFDILIISAFRHERKEKYGHITFYTADARFLGILQELKREINNSGGSNYICCSDELSFENPYIEKTPST